MTTNDGFQCKFVPTPQGLHACTVDRFVSLNFFGSKVLSSDGNMFGGGQCHVMFDSCDSSIVPKLDSGTGVTQGISDSQIKIFEADYVDIMSTSLRHFSK